MTLADRFSRSAETCPEPPLIGDLPESWESADVLARYWSLLRTGRPGRDPDGPPRKYADPAGQSLFRGAVSTRAKMP